ncbi:MAG TPA: branched-chain amino acid ABC transporter permease [Acidimicrobiia bacterium]|nr:branched-chain amino acid ABC transporter permease [Acidimicrobiia bacterium]
MTAVILDGIVLGLQFGLLGVGLTLVYGLGGVLNLAHGQLAVVAAVVVTLVSDTGTAAGVAVAAGLLAAGVLGLLLDSTLMQPVYRQRGESRVLLGLLLTLGVAFMIDGFLIWRYPTRGLSLNIGGGAIPILGVRMRSGSLLASAISVVAGIGLVAFFRGSKLGRAVRSVIQDEEGARLVGVDPAAARRLIFVLSGVLAGLVAVTRSMTSPVTVTAGIDFTILALIVTVVGGLGSVLGAFLAGILLGIVNTVSSFYIGTYVTTIMLLLAAVLTIVFRPTGLLGRRT